MRILSGIQPTGIPHIGNYLGTLKNWVKLSNSSAENECFFSIVDLHSITVSQDPIILKNNIHSMAVSLLACGINSDNVSIFRQSMVSQHSELAWIMFCKTPVNWLSRMHHWKGKTESKSSEIDQSKANLGLFAYPVLQAADILLYEYFSLT